MIMILAGLSDHWVKEVCPVGLVHLWLMESQYKVQRNDVVMVRGFYPH